MSEQNAAAWPPHGSHLPPEEPDSATATTTKTPAGPFVYHLHAQDGQARRGHFSTRHGPIQMPAVAPVGTLVNVKTLEPRDLSEPGAELSLRMASVNAVRRRLTTGCASTRARAAVLWRLNWS